MSYTILMADDDEDIINIMRLYIETIGYIFVSASNGREALHIFQQQHVDIMVVDIEMPIMNGYELVENVRSVSNIPILVLSVKGRDNDRIKGLNAGVDDYICKPFNPMEVVARITANLRRFYNLGGAKDSEVKNQVISHGDISLDISKMQLFVQGKNVLITPTEFRILSIMLQAPGQVFTKAQLRSEERRVGKGC